MSLFYIIGLKLIITHNTNTHHKSWKIIWHNNWSHDHIIKSLIEVMWPTTKLRQTHASYKVLFYLYLCQEQLFAIVISSYRCFFFWIIKNFDTYLYIDNFTLFLDWCSLYIFCSKSKYYCPICNWSVSGYFCSRITNIRLKMNDSRFKHFSVSIINFYCCRVWTFQY